MRARGARECALRRRRGVVGGGYSRLRLPSRPFDEDGAERGVHLGSRVGTP